MVESLSDLCLVPVTRTAISVTPAAEDLTPSLASAGIGHTCDIYIYVQAKHSHTHTPPKKTLKILPSLSRMRMSGLLWFICMIT